MDAVSWLIMFASLALIRARLPERGGWRTITVDSLRAGFRFVWGHAVIFAFLMMDFGLDTYGVTIYGLCLLVFATSQIFWLSILLLIASGIGDTISAILRSTINQLSTPDELRGGMASINSGFTNSGAAARQFQAGLLAALIGTELAATSGALIILFIVAVIRG